MGCGEVPIEKFRCAKVKNTSYETYFYLKGINLLLWELNFTSFCKLEQKFQNLAKPSFSNLLFTVISINSNVLTSVCVCVCVTQDVIYFRLDISLKLNRKASLSLTSKRLHIKYKNIFTFWILQIRNENW